MGGTPRGASRGLRRGMALAPLSLAALAGLALALSPSEPAPWVRALGSMVKLRAGDRLPEGRQSIELTVARGECEGAQLAAEAPVSGVVATATPLRAKHGGTLEVRLYREAFIKVSEPSNFEGRAGRWPDPLIPAVDLYSGERRNAFPASSRGAEPVVLYLEVCAPQAAAPGTYHGHVVAKAKDRPTIRFPTQVRVRSFALPATSSLETSFGFSGLSAVRGHGLGDEAVGQLTRLYATAALRHRISLHGMSMEPPRVVNRDPLELDFGAYDAEVGPFLDGTALENGARFTSIDVRLHPKAKSEDELLAYLRAYAQHLRQRGWLSRAFIYAKDEPRPEDLPLVRRIAETAHKADGELRVLVTTSLNPLIEGVIDILAPNINCLFPRPGDAYCRGVVPLDRYQAARQKGAKLWWYQSCGSHGCGPVPASDLQSRAYFSGWPSYMVDHPAALNRAMGVLAFRHGVEGELYFNTVEAWNPGPRGEPANPWECVWRFHGNGDGTLFYPGTPERIGGKGHVPVESLRLKHLRDGLEDYEYLKLARDLGLGAQAEQAAASLAFKPYLIEREPGRWRQVREALADQIEQASARARE
ncbi:MAG: DUF4091 domain-containing protein [Myxococcales bacterium]|jgi:hypothetical protein